MQAGSLYWLLAAVRSLSAISPGYLHPDEHFQSPEVAAGLLGFCAGVPWEFQSGTQPHRSLLPPYVALPAPLLAHAAGVHISVGHHPLCSVLMSYAPMAALVQLKAFLGQGRCCDTAPAVPYTPHEASPAHTACPVTFPGTPTGWELLVAVRVWMLVLSFALDWLLFRALAHSGRRAQWGSLLAMSSCWVWLAFAPRPFSNTAELWVAVGLLAVVARWDASSELQRTWSAAALAGVAVGLLTALGMFARFTAVLLGIPVALCIAVQLMNRKGKVRLSTCCVSPAQGPATPGPPHSLAPLASFVVSGVLAWTAVSVVCAALDTLLFTGAWPWHRDSWVLAPLHSALYNADPANTMQHGAHPWWHHAVLNAPSAFSFLALAAYWKAGTAMLRCRPQQPNPSGTQSDDAPTPLLESSCWGMLCVYLGALSMAPHQELRFLVPLLVPLAVLVWPAVVQLQHDTHPRSSQPTAKLAWWWSLVNVCSLVFVCWLHQAGVVPALSSIPPATAPRALITYGLYMPPEFVNPTPFHPAWCSHRQPAWMQASPLWKPVQVPHGSLVAASRLVDVHDSTVDLACALRDIARRVCCDSALPALPSSSAVHHQASWPAAPEQIVLLQPARMASVARAAMERDTALGKVQCGAVQVSDASCKCRSVRVHLESAATTPWHYSSEFPPHVRNISGPVDAVQGVLHHMQLVALTYSVKPGDTLPSSEAPSAGGMQVGATGTILSDGEVVVS